MGLVIFMPCHATQYLCSDVIDVQGYRINVGLMS